MYVVLEVAGGIVSEKVWGWRISAWILRKTENEQFSWLRVGYAVGIGLLALIVCIIGVVFLNQSPSFHQFMSEHFIW